MMHVEIITAVISSPNIKGPLEPLGKSIFARGGRKRVQFVERRESSVIHQVQEVGESTKKMNKKRSIWKLKKSVVFDRGFFDTKSP